MNAQKRARSKKFYTLEEANATLPLLRSILRDITELARSLRERLDRLTRIVTQPAVMGDAYREEQEQIQNDVEQDQERMQEYVQELKNLHVELKDYDTGLVDFPCWLDGRAVYLCWRLGEPEIGYWHELDAGFSGRQKLLKDAAGR
jgi:hypothetical protein